MTGGLSVCLVSFGRDEIDRKGRTHEPQCQRRREKDQFVTKGGREEEGGSLLAWGAAAMTSPMMPNSGVKRVEKHHGLVK